MSRVSVIVPNYNRAALIGETIRNLLAQSRPPHEIIVVDDGSTDHSAEVVRGFGKPVRLVQQANQGPGAARNRGLKEAEGDFIQFQDSDDLLSLNKLQAQAEQLEQTGADMALGPWAHVHLQGRAVHFESCVLQQALPPSRISLNSWMLRGWTTVFQSLMFRREFLLASGGYREDLRYGEDMEFLFRILARSPRVAFAGDTLTLYRLDAPNKLSQNGGRAKLNRDLDWATVLLSMKEQAQALKLQADWMTRLIFVGSMRRHLRHSAGLAGASAETAMLLESEAGKVPGLILQLADVWLRLTERIRLSRSGFRWMPAYQSGPATVRQTQLISEMGLAVDPQKP